MSYAAWGDAVRKLGGEMKNGVKRGVFEQRDAAQNFPWGSMEKSCPFLGKT